MVLTSKLFPIDALRTVPFVMRKDVRAVALPLVPTETVPITVEVLVPTRVIVTGLPEF